MKIQFNEIKQKKSNRVMVVDNVGGAYLPIAIRLSEHFDNVGYYSVNQSPFPRMALDLSLIHI